MSLAADFDVLPGNGRLAWTSGHLPSVATPDPFDDVFFWRADTADGDPEPIGWDFGYLGEDGHWYSTTYAGERIPTPVRWWPMPSTPPMGKRI